MTRKRGWKRKYRNKFNDFCLKDEEEEEVDEGKEDEEGEKREEEEGKEEKKIHTKFIDSFICNYAWTDKI